SPDYWRDKYESFRLLQDMRQVAVKKQPAPVLPPTPVERREPIRWRDEWTQLRTLLQRAFISKLRNHANLWTTIVEEPVLSSLFAALQCALFVLIGNAILEVRGMFGTYMFYNFITAVGGIAIGLLISSLVADTKTAANIVPLVLIPQIILGGALIKYEEMNRN